MNIATRALTPTAGSADLRALDAAAHVGPTAAGELHLGSPADAANGLHVGIDGEDADLGLT